MQIREKEISQDVREPRERCRRCRTLSVLHTLKPPQQWGWSLQGSRREPGLSWTRGLPAGVQLNSSDAAAHTHWNGGTKSTAGGGWEPEVSLWSGGYRESGENGLWDDGRESEVPASCRHRQLHTEIFTGLYTYSWYTHIFLWLVC